MGVLSVVLVVIRVLVLWCCLVYRIFSGMCSKWLSVIESV